MTQVAPMATSIGRWRVGPIDQHYGRFARQFEGKTGKTSMGFVLDRRLWGGLPLTHNHNHNTNTKSIALTIGVHYLDGDGNNGENAWSPTHGTNAHNGGADGTSLVIRYDGAGNNCVTAATLPIKNTGRWVKLELNVTNASFNGHSASCVVNGTKTKADIVLDQVGGLT